MGFGELIARAYEGIADSEVHESSENGDNGVTLDHEHMTVPAGKIRVVIQAIAFHDDTDGAHDLIIGKRHVGANKRLWYGRLLGATSGQPAFIDHGRPLILVPGDKIEVWLQGAGAFAVADLLTVRTEYVEFDGA